MDVQELAMTAVRTVIVYIFVLIVVRLLGKREVGNFTAFDLIVAFMISEVVDEPIFGDVPMVQGLLVIAAIGLLEFINSSLGYRFPAFNRLTGGAPRVLVREGKLDRKAMGIERINEEELLSMLRENEIDEDELKEVKVATLERDGQLSVIKTDEAKELQKGDLAQARRQKKG